MSDASAVLTAGAPQPVGPYSQAIKSGGFLFCSGQIGIDPKTGAMREGVEAQTRQVLDNISAVLAAADLTLAHIVKTTIFLLNMGDFATVNALYAERFGTPPPARSTIGIAALPLGAVVEIEVIASTAF
jgi:2-iminobutanoate/2-iminopropanoate deaminase